MEIQVDLFWVLWWLSIGITVMMLIMISVVNRVRNKKK